MRALLFATVVTLLAVGLGFWPPRVLLADEPPTTFEMNLRLVPELTVSGPPGSRVKVESAATPSGPWTKWSTVVIGVEGVVLVDLSPDSVQSFYRAVDDSGTTSLEDLVWIPPGAFEMGASIWEGERTEHPVHTVFASAFYMGRTEVTKAQWDEVREWAVNNGYTDLPAGGGKGANHPVHSVSSYDVMKWCNAASERAGLTPVYRVNDAVYRTGSWTWNQDPGSEIRYTANGYRLPSEAEWEKAARGGLSGRRFPWGDTISHSQANYSSHSLYAYDVSSTRGYHPTYAVGGDPYTSPVGSFAPNGHGLYDMAGNVWEWCNDWWGENYYTNSPAADPRGPVSGSNRVLRGGSWYDGAFRCRSAYRSYYDPGHSFILIGFRLARSSVP